MARVKAPEPIVQGPKHYVRRDTPRKASERMEIVQHGGKPIKLRGLHLTVNGVKVAGECTMYVGKAIGPQKAICTKCREEIAAVAPRREHEGAKFCAACSLECFPERTPQPSVFGKFLPEWMGGTGPQRLRSSWGGP